VKAHIEMLGKSFVVILGTSITPCERDTSSDTSLALDPVRG
jgi:hypothetical protein